VRKAERSRSAYVNWVLLPLCPLKINRASSRVLTEDRTPSLKHLNALSNG